MHPDAWIESLKTAIDDFDRTRGRGFPVVQVTLDDGEQLYLHRAEPGPGPFVTLHPYPEDRERSMVRGADDASYTPRTIMVLPPQIVKIELLVSPDGGGSAAAVPGSASREQRPPVAHPPDRRGVGLG